MHNGFLAGVLKTVTARTPFTQRRLCNINAPTSEQSRAMSHAGRPGGAGRGHAARQAALLAKSPPAVTPGASGIQSWVSTQVIAPIHFKPRSVQSLPLLLVGPAPAGAPGTGQSPSVCSGLCLGRAMVGHGAGAEGQLVGDPAGDLVLLQ